MATTGGAQTSGLEREQAWPLATRIVCARRRRVLGYAHSKLRVLSMDFAEIAFQNVAGFPATARVSLEPRLNAFVSPETDLFLVLRALFGPLDEDLSALRGMGTPRKLALTIHGDDGNNYRLVRDLDGGRWSSLGPCRRRSP